MSRWVADSPTCWVGESAIERLKENSCRYKHLQLEHHYLFSLNSKRALTRLTKLHGECSRIFSHISPWIFSLLSSQIFSAQTSSPHSPTFWVDESLTPHSLSRRLPDLTWLNWGVVDSPTECRVQSAPPPRPGASLTTAKQVFVFFTIQGRAPACSSRVSNPRHLKKIYVIRKGVANTFYISKVVATTL
jgi:hypothetical protein